MELCYNTRNGGDVKHMTKDERARFTFRIPIKLMQLLREESEEKGISINSLILQILWDGIKDKKGGKRHGVQRHPQQNQGLGG